MQLQAFDLNRLLCLFLLPAKVQMQEVLRYLRLWLEQLQVLAELLECGQLVVQPELKVLGDFGLVSGLRIV